MFKTSVYALKPAFQRLLSPLLETLYSLRVTPNFLTVSTCLLSIAIGTTITFIPDVKFFFILPFFLLLRMALNALDGMMAKKYNMQSNLGVYLNEICDVISDLALYCPFLNLAFMPHGSLLILILLSVLTEVSSLVMVTLGEKRAFQGPFGKADRALFFSILAFMVAYNIHQSSTYFILVSFGIFLSLLTIWNRGPALLLLKEKK